MKTEIILTLKEIEKATGGRLFPKGDTPGITGVCTDNRILNAGELFIAVAGQKTDGHKFIGRAFERGASCVISEKELEEPKGSYILVDSSLDALKRIATYYRSTLSIPIIGVTGSVGKTGTKEMISAVLSTGFNVHKTAGNFNNDIGLPLTIMGIRPEHEVAVVEMGISDFGEMHVLGDIAKPDKMVFTNIRECHLEFLKDLQGVLRAKSEVLSHMPYGADVFINGDDKTLSNIPSHDIKLHTFGVQHGDMTGRIIEDRGIEGTTVVLSDKTHTINADIHLPGAHNIYHALAAASLGLVMGLSPGDISEGISSVNSLGGRNNIIRTDGGITIIDDCYNASPASMNAAIHTLSMAGGRKVAILGDMGELGDNSIKIHSGIGDNPDLKNIDCVYSVGSLSANIVSRLNEVGYNGDSGSFETVEGLLEVVPKMIKPGDTVLVKASHFMEFNRIVDHLKAPRSIS